MMEMALSVYQRLGGDTSSIDVGRMKRRLLEEATELQDSDNAQEEREEVVDVLFFLMVLARGLGLDWATLGNEFMNKFRVNSYRLETRTKPHLHRMVRDMDSMRVAVGMGMSPPGGIDAECALSHAMRYINETGQYSEFISFTRGERND